MDEKELAAIQDWLSKNPSATNADVMKAFPVVKDDKTADAVFGYAHGLEQGNSPKKLQSYFPELFPQAQPTAHQAAVKEAAGTLQNAYNSPQGNKAIDYLSQQAHDLAFSTGRQQQVQKQDATYQRQLPPVLLHQDKQMMQDEYRKNNPNPTPETISAIGHLNPEQAPDLNAASYLQQGASRDADRQKQLANAQAIKSGKLMYNPHNGALTKPLGPLDSIVHGWNQRKQSLAGYDQLTDKPDTEAIGYLNQQIAKKDPDTPEPTPYNWGQLTSGLGSEAVPTAKMIIAGGAATALGQPELAPGAAVVATGGEYYKRSYHDSMVRNYAAMKAKGMSDADALAHSRPVAEHEAELGVLQNAAMTAAGARLGMQGEYAAFNQPGVKKVLGTVVDNLGKFGKSALKEGSVNAALSAGVQMKENEMEGKNTMEGTLDAGLMGGVMPIALGLMIHAPKEIISGHGLDIVKQALTKVPTEHINAELGSMVQDGSITPDKAMDIQKAIAEHKAKDDVIPPSVKDDEARVLIQGKIAKRTELETQLKSVAEPYKEGIKERIAKIDTDIQEIPSQVKAKQAEAEKTTPNESVKQPGASAELPNRDGEPSPDSVKEKEKGAEASDATPPAAGTGSETGRVVDETHPMLEARHAPTEHDAQEIVSGQNQLGLSEDGKAKAEALRDDVHADHAPTKIISSDLQRAKQTADIVADGKIPTEERPELRSWDLGEFSGSKDADFKPAQRYFVEHPDATEYQGKKVGESFNQYKDRAISAKEKVQEEEPDAMVISHSNNMAIYDAYKENGNKWDAKAAQDYLSSKTPEAAEIHSTPEEGATAEAVVAGKIPEEQIAKAITDEIASRKTVRRSSKQQPKSDEVDGAPGRTSPEEGNEGSARAPVEGTPAGGESEARSAGVPADTGAADKTGRVKEHAEFEKEVEAAFAGGRVKGKVVKTEGDRVWVEAKDGTKYPVSKKDILKQGEGVIEHYDTRARMNESGAHPEAKDAIRSLGNKTPEAYADPHRALQTIREEHPDDKLLNRAIDFLGPVLKDTKSRIENVPGLKSSRGEKVLGLHHRDGKIQVDFSAHQDMESVHRTIVHELLHEATSRELSWNKSFQKEVRNILEHVRDKNLGVSGEAVDKAIPLLLNAGKIEGYKYGYSNPDELLSEVFTNQKFRDELSKIPAPDSTKDAPKNILQKIYETIVNALYKHLGILKDEKYKISASDMGDYLMRLSEETITGDKWYDRYVKGLMPKEEMAMAQGLTSDESQLVNFIKRSPDSMSDHDLGDILENHSAVPRDRINDLIDAHRDTLQGDDAEALVKRALEIGKETYAQAKKNPLTPKLPPETPSTMNKLSRWFGGRQDEVTDVKGIIRTRKGAEEYELNKIYKASNDLRDMWNKKSREQQLAFQLMMQKPDMLKNQPQEVQDAAAAYRKRFDASYDVIQSVAPNASYLDDYFPGFWKKPDLVRNFFANAVSKSPLEGSKSFLKQKFFDTILDGLRKGYQPITYNPEEMVRLAEANAWKFKTAHDILSDMKKKGLLQYSIGKDIPSGWQTIKDPLFQRMSMYLDGGTKYDGVPVGGEPAMSKGAYYMPAEVAKLINDYQSAGLKGSAKKVIQTYNNIKNTFQLGAGGFHFVTTAIDNAVTGTSIGVQNLTRGNILGAVSEFAKSASFIPTTVESLYKGMRAVADYNKGKLTEDVQSLIDANAKVGKQRMYTMDAQYNMKKAWGQMLANKDVRQILPFLGNAAMWAPEAINKPLMEKWVPGLKVGGYLRALKSEIAARPNMTPQELQTSKEKIWDSMDDRLGQVVYDNVFMNKAYKDLAFMAIRSAGWTGGTIRSAVKGAAELPLSASRVMKGEGVSQRFAYLLSLPLTVGFFGGAYHYMNTGQPPETLEDYFYPKDGTKEPDGSDHRVALPSYMKDYISYGKKPTETLMHKTSPILNDAVELYQNKDFYGVRLYNPDDPIYQKGIDVLKHEAQTMVPFSSKSQPYTNPTMKQRIEQGFGMLPAPKETEHTPTENAISKAYISQMGHEAEGRTKEDLEKSVARKHLREYIFNGGDYENADQEMKDKAAITDKSLKTFIEEAKMPPAERYFSHLKPETKISLYQQMKPEEKKQYVQYMPKDWENPEESAGDIIPIDHNAKP